MPTTSLTWVLLAGWFVYSFVSFPLLLFRRVKDGREPFTYSALLHLMTRRMRAIAVGHLLWLVAITASGGANVETIIFVLILCGVVLGIGLENLRFGQQQLRRLEERQEAKNAGSSPGFERSDTHP